MPADTNAPLQQTQTASVVSYIRARKILFVCGLVVAFVLLQVALLPFGEVSKLASTNPGETAFQVYQAEQAKELHKPFRKRQTWVGLNRVSKSLVDAVIVSEDGTFWSHSGFDWYEFRESFERNMKEGRAARGASTISQQLVKNLYLSPSKNPIRKLKEWILTWWLEQRVSKSRILELYLNLIEWGDGVYGIQAASQFYFKKSAGDLSLDEATRLAAIIPSPRRWSLAAGSRIAERRAGIILQRMQLRGMIPAVSGSVPVDSASIFAPLPEEGDTLPEQQSSPSVPPSQPQDSTTTREL